MLRHDPPVFTDALPTGQHYLAIGCLSFAARGGKEYLELRQMHLGQA